MIPVIDLTRDVQQRIMQAPRATIANAYVRAARQFCGETRWYRMNLAGMLTEGQSLYSLGADPFLEVIAVPLVSMQVNPTGTQSQNWIPLWAMPSQGFSPNLQPNSPMWFSYVPEGQVAFWPIPNAAYAVNMTLALQPRDAVDALPEELLPKWRLAFEAGALEYLYSLTGERWANAKLSEQNRAIFRSYINNARADVALGNQMGSQRAMPRRFVIGGAQWW